MARTRIARSVLVVSVLLAVGVLGSATASAAVLDDYLWKQRPLLLFAPMANDPRLVETQKRIEASRCDFVERDMVLGRVVSEGDSTLDGQVVDTDEARRLIARYAVDENAFTAVLIGKDGGEKFRVNGVPDLDGIYAVIDGMPMRQNEANDGRC